jgi:ferredoxin
MNLEALQRMGIEFSSERLELDALRRDLWPRNTRLLRDSEPAPAPAIIAWPRSRDGVEALLAGAASDGRAVTPYGAGSSVSGAAVGAAERRVIDTKRMNRILDIVLDAGWVDGEPGISRSTRPSAIRSADPIPQRKICPARSLSTLRGRTRTSLGFPDRGPSRVGRNSSPPPRNEPHSRFPVEPGLRHMKPSDFESCVYCPRLCRHVCPVAAGSGGEAATPTAMMTGAWQWPRDSATAEEALESATLCTQCGACEEHCKLSRPVSALLSEAIGRIRDAPSTPPLEVLGEGSWVAVETDERRWAEALARHLSEHIDAPQTERIYPPCSGPQLEGSTTPFALSCCGAHHDLQSHHPGIASETGAAAARELGKWSHAYPDSACTLQLRRHGAEVHDPIDWLLASNPEP